MQTEKQKFMEWLEREQQKGLTHFHISTVGLKILATATSEEEAYRQLNEMNAAIDAGLATPLTGL